MPTSRYAELLLPGEAMDNFPAAEEEIYGRVLTINIHQVDFAARELLTEKQYVVFCALRRGQGIAAIARKMGISPRMVYKHFERLRKRLRRHYETEEAMLIPRDQPAAVCPRCKSDLEALENGYAACRECEKVFFAVENAWRYAAELRGFVKGDFGGKVSEIMVVGDAAKSRKAKEIEE